MLALGRQHAAVAGGGRAAGRARALGEGDLGVVGQGAVAHAGDHDRDVELDRLLGEARAEDGRRRAALAIALERDARQRAGEERQVVEGRQVPRPERAEAADAVAAQLGLDLDVLDDVRACRRGSWRGAVSERRLPCLQVLACRSSRACGPRRPSGRRAGPVDAVAARASRGSPPARRRLASDDDRVVAQRGDLAADEDDALVHRVGQRVAGVAADDDRGPAAS